MARKKPEPEGIAAILAKPEQVSIQELTMLDFFASFSAISWPPMTSHKDAAKEVWDRAEAMMNEREQRL